MMILDADLLLNFFLFTSIINLFLLFFGFMVIALARGWVYRMHSRWYPMTEEEFNRAIYRMMGIYKILIFVFCVVPYIALRIVV